MKCQVSLLTTACWAATRSAHRMRKLYHDLWAHQHRASSCSNREVPCLNLSRIIDYANWQVLRSFPRYPLTNAGISASNSPLPRKPESYYFKFTVSDFLSYFGKYWCNSKYSKIVPLRHTGDKRKRCSSYSFLTSALDGVSDQRHALAALYPRGKDPLYPLDRRLGGPQSWSGHRV
jgi:hypothetical protein